MNARLLYLCFSSDFVFISFINAQVEDQGEPTNVEEVQRNVTGYDSGTSDFVNREHAAPTKD